MSDHMGDLTDDRTGDLTGDLTVGDRLGVDEHAGAAAAARIPLDVPCRAHLRRWTALEHRYPEARRSARRKMCDLIGDVCNLCPALEECALWAREDRYTGFAAGTWFFRGRPPLRHTRASAE